MLIVLCRCIRMSYCQKVTQNSDVHWNELHAPDVLRVLVAEKPNYCQKHSCSLKWTSCAEGCPFFGYVVDFRRVFLCRMNESQVRRHRL
ncbi:unnamed protein product [Darwinula stevensoni]|uniref:Uncharacterized protein n=1 Tax=Darwinula stevensoni TaxID=69355 RepID=A0A7R9ADP4_9CRUS|nr:unnamed protein product [Darwinula stevensoni]CAG0901194.1 unnamed protein product [Darwinula stevensoni]